MFSRLRHRKAAAGRKDRPPSRDSAESKPPSRKDMAHTVTVQNKDVSPRPSTGDSKSASLSASAPVLPPIPRIASQVSRSPTSPTSPDIPTIRTVQLLQQPSEVHASPDDADASLPPDPLRAEPTDHDLEPVSSIDRAKAELRADKDHIDAMQIPPPSSAAATRPRISITKPQMRSWTDLPTRPISKGSENTSSYGFSTIHEIPTPYRLDEPKEYIMPSLDVDAQSQSSQRPRSRLMRLNPLSYLSRKRTSQISVEGVDNSALIKRASFTPFRDVSQTFDPRIIGERVHDFSTPMPSQYLSVQDLRSLAMEEPPTGVYLDPRRGSDSNLPQRDPKDTSPERRHVPIFKEDFSDSAEGWRLDPEDRRNQVTTNIVDKVAALEEVEKTEKRKSALPAFAQHMPQDIPTEVAADVLGSPAQQKLSPRPPNEQDLYSSPNSIQQTPDSLKPPKDVHRSDTSPGASPLADRSGAGSPDTPHTLSSLPRHMRSKTASVRSQASRFSFDMVGSGSAAQEKMLEEKHRERAAAQRARGSSMTRASIYEEDDFNDDDIDFNDGLEEEIPGMGDDDYAFNGGGLSNMTLDSPISRVMQNGHDDEISYEGDDDFGTGNMTGGLGNMTLDSFKAKSGPVSVTASRHMPSSSDSSIKGLGLNSDLASTSRDMPTLTPETSTSKKSPVDAKSPLRSLKKRVQLDINDLENGDFYFNDGEFDEELDRYDALLNGESFDESMLDESMLDDDNYVRGKPLNPTEGSLRVDDITRDSSHLSLGQTSSDNIPPADRPAGLAPDTGSASMAARRSSAYGDYPESEGQTGLTQENLDAYHNALAFATNQAALQGRFERKASDHSWYSASPTADADLQRKMMPPPSFIPNRSPQNDDFDFDDAIEDDAIIAAANAEALENDDEGFYGQEFGFYAHTNGTGEAQAFHGGFFGPGGLNLVKRSHSGRVDFQEPSLTPITERSEWSNRNSMISLAMQSGIPPGGPSMSSAPGLAQLADQMQHDGSMDDMSLGALMRARRSVFGGSSTSLDRMGTGGSRSGSPNQYAPLQPPQSSHPAGYGYHHSATFSEDNIASPQQQQPRPASSLSQSSMTNPMLSLQTHNLSLRPTTSSSDSSPLKRSSATRDRPGHSRNSSSAESVSYAMERDEGGGNQWFLERRRTLENGETEVLGREIIQGTL